MQRPAAGYPYDHDLLAGWAFAVGATATITASRRAAAQQKVSQADAKYQNRPKEQQRCEICLNFQPPNVCQFVESRISPKR